MEFIQKHAGCLGDIRERCLLAVARDRIKHIVFLANRFKSKPNARGPRRYASRKTSSEGRDADGLQPARRLYMGIRSGLLRRNESART